MIFNLFKKKYFKLSDRKVIEKFKFDPDAEILYEVLKGYIYWDDEIIFGQGLSKHGYCRLKDLLLARCFLYHDPNRNIDDEYYYIKVWILASSEISGWPGFRSERLNLSQKEWEFYQNGLKNH